MVKAAEVADRIYRIETEFAGRVNAVYYLWGAHRSLLVDTTTRHTAGSVLRAVAALGAPPPDWVVSTHADWDHVAGNGAVRAAAPGARFLCHERDRAMIEDVELLITERYGEFAAPHGYDETPESKDAVRDGTSSAPIDIGLTGGEKLDLGDGRIVTILHTPGHSHGSISVDDVATGTVIVGDAVLGSAVPLADGAPAFPPTYRYVDDYLATIDVLERRAANLLLTSHYPVMDASAAKVFLSTSREFASLAESKLREALQSLDKPAGLLELAQQLSPALGQWPPEAAPALLFPLSGHIERLSSGGHLKIPRDESSVTRYAWAS